MKIKNISTESKSVTCPHLERGVTVAAGEVADFPAPTAKDLIASFPSVWEAADAKPTKSKKES